MIIDCISDLHGEYPELKGGDLLIVAGDLTGSDKFSQYDAFFKWLEGKKYRRKILVGGNHDNLLMSYRDDEQWPEPICYYMDWIDTEYLCDSGTQFEGLKIWGSPWTHTFPGMNPHCMAFTKPPGQLKEHWAMIPDDTDILVTHGPPYGILDKNKHNVKCGCPDLYARVNADHNLRPKLHVFGHIHEGYGKKLSEIEVYEDERTIFVNASLMNGDYEFVNKPVRVIL